jgi:hypothetical protein
VRAWFIWTRLWNTCLVAQAKPLGHAARAEPQRRPLVSAHQLREGCAGSGEESAARAGLSVARTAQHHLLRLDRDARRSSQLALDHGGRISRLQLDRDQRARGAPDASMDHLQGSVSDARGAGSMPRCHTFTSVRGIVAAGWTGKKDSSRFARVASSPESSRHLTSARHVAESSRRRVHHCLARKRLLAARECLSHHGGAMRPDAQGSRPRAALEVQGSLEVRDAAWRPGQLASLRAAERCPTPTRHSQQGQSPGSQAQELQAELLVGSPPRGDAPLTRALRS